MASPDDLLRALEGLTQAIDRVDKAQAARAAQAKLDKERQRQARDAVTAENKRQREEKQQGKEEESEAKKEEAGKSSPVGKLLSAYRAAGYAGQGVGGALRGNVSGAVQGLLGAGEQAGVASDAVAGSLGDGAVGAAGGAAVGVVAGFAAAGYAAYEFKRALDESTKSTINNYRELAKYSGSMAAVLAQRDVRELLRDQEKGERLADVAGALTQAEQDREDKGKELDIAWQELKAGFLTQYNQVLGEILDMLSGIAVSLRDYFGGNEAVDVETLGESLDKAAAKTEKALDRHRAGLPPLGQGKF